MRLGNDAGAAAIPPFRAARGVLRLSPGGSSRVPDRVTGRAADAGNRTRCRPGSP